MTDAAYQTGCERCGNTHTAAARYCPWCGRSVANSGDLDGVVDRDLVAYHLRHALEHATDARGRVAIRRALQWVLTVADREAVES